MLPWRGAWAERYVAFVFESASASHGPFGGRKGGGDAAGRNFSDPFPFRRPPKAFTPRPRFPPPSRVVSSSYLGPPHRLPTPDPARTRPSLRRNSLSVPVPASRGRSRSGVALTRRCPGATTTTMIPTAKGRRRPSARS